MLLWGIEIGEIFRLITQIGFVLIASSALWGFVFRLKANREGGAGGAYAELAERLLVFLFVAFAIAGLGWLSLSYYQPLEALSHEGVMLDPSPLEITQARLIKAPLMAWLSVIVFAGLILYLWRKKDLQKLLAIFYPIVFLFALVLIALPAWSGEGLSLRQLFFFGHSVHSIMTLGTVLCLDYLFHLSEKYGRLREALYPNLDNFSKVIWVGLGIDFLSVFLVFPEALQLTDKFYFMQAIIGILILNGSFLSGPLTKKFLSLAKSDGAYRVLSGRWGVVAGISGVISVVSWSTITIVDGFAHLTLNYYELALLYGLAILLGWLFYFGILKRHPLSTV